jgi:hypothetical protein
MPRLAGSAKLLRAMNSSATLAHLLQAGQLTRAELRERTGLSKPASSEMLRLLTDAGLAIVTGRTAGSVGPTAEIYAPNADAAYAVAISVRDTLGPDRPALAIAVCDFSATLRDRAERRIDFARVGPGQAVARAVADACDRAGINPRRVRHVQVGVAGSYDPRTDVLHHVDVPGWARPGLADVRARHLTDATVRLRTTSSSLPSRERHRKWRPRGLLPRSGSTPALPRTRRHAADPAAARRNGYPRLRRTRTDWSAARRFAPPLYAASRATPAPEAVAAAVAGQVDPFFQQFGPDTRVATVIAVLDPPLVVLAGEVAQAGGARLRDAVAAATRSNLPSTSAATLGQPQPSGLSDADVQIAVTAVDDDAVLLGGLDAGLTALHESLISSLALPTTD